MLRSNQSPTKTKRKLFEGAEQFPHGVYLDPAKLAQLNSTAITVDVIIINYHSNTAEAFVDQL